MHATANASLETMMSLLRTTRILTRNTVRRQGAVAVTTASNTNNRCVPKCYFSAEPSAMEENIKPLIPGIGRGKTSTGLVREIESVMSLFYHYFLCICLFINVLISHVGLGE